MQKIQFLGAAGEVTGSSFLLTGNNGARVLIDLGLFQGTADIQALNFSPLVFNAKDLQAVFLTHAHLDHCGRLPILTKAGFSGKVYATEATKMITQISLLDSAKIAKEDKQSEILYTEEDVEKLCNLIESVACGQRFTVGGMEVTYHDAGHILGSASIEISDHGDKPQTIIFSGDLGNSPQDLIRPTEYITTGNIAVMESTYGGSTHPQENVPQALATEITAVEKTGGALLIPAFSIERTQEIIHILGHLEKAGQINNTVPIYLDSPMANKVTEVFKKYPQLYNLELSGDVSPFEFSNLKTVTSVDESKAVLKVAGAKVIISGSGMMNGGRILHHLKNYLGLPTTRILIVGYQAVGTLGREIEDGAKQVTIYGKHIPVQATISKLEALSSHADQPKLLLWLKHIQGVSKVFLVHGEDKQRDQLAGKIKTELGISDILLPTQNQVFDLN